MSGNYMGNTFTCKLARLECAHFLKRGDHFLDPQLLHHPTIMHALVLMG